MILVSILLVVALWVCSLFTFGRWRFVRAVSPEKPGSVSADLIFQNYLKLSGLAVLAWIGLMLTRPA